VVKTKKARPRRPLPADAAEAADEDRPRPRIGRPPVAAADRHGKDVRVLTTYAEYEELKRAAASVSMSVSTWMRSVALERARQMAKKARQEERQEEHGVDSD
jgi:hypothetical protein